MKQNMLLFLAGLISLLIVAGAEQVSGFAFSIQHFYPAHKKCVCAFEAAFFHGFLDVPVSLINSVFFASFS
jgi:hypothetical protein